MNMKYWEEEKAYEVEHRRHSIRVATREAVKRKAVVVSKKLSHAKSHVLVLCCVRGAFVAVRVPESTKSVGIMLNVNVTF